MPGPVLCARCGRSYTPSPALAACPNCLLGLASPGQGLDQVEVPEGLRAALPDYEILECLGRGGMGLVFRARQRKLDRIVALKVLPADAARDPSFATRFEREARALARLNHPGIVGIHDFGEAGGHHWLAMEYVDGVDLRRLEQERVTPQQALELVQQICAALQYAHASGVVHRDIKPENILVDREGRVKVGDFGLAKVLRQGDAQLTRPTQVMGTLHYMAPEQLERPAEVDHRADLFALGVVFYELLCGELPVGRFAPPSQHAAVDPRLDDVVLRALERDRELRYQTAADLQSDVERIRSGPVVPQRAPRRRMPWLIAAAVLVVAVALVAWWQSRHPQLRSGQFVQFLPGYIGRKFEWAVPLQRRFDYLSVSRDRQVMALHDLETVFGDYMRLELEHAQVKVLDDGRVQVDVAAFAPQREALIARIDRVLPGGLGLPAEQMPDVHPRLGFALACDLMPCGGDSCNFAIGGEGGMQPWSAYITPGTNFAEPAVERFWASTWLPTPSCLGPAQKLLALLREPPAGARLELDLIESAGKLHSIAFELQCEEYESAPAALAALRDGFSRQPWCEQIGSAQTEVDVNGKQMKVAWTNFKLPGKPLPRQVGKDLPRGDHPQVAVKRLAAERLGIKDLQSPTWQPLQTTGFVAAGYDFTAGEQTRTLSFDEALQFLLAIEELGPFCTVGSFRLRRAARGSEQWRLEKFTVWTAQRP